MAITTHHPELLPETLLLKIAETQAQTPFPVMLESLLLYFMYEVMREAGLRAPRGPEHHGEYCGRSGHWRYGSFRRACQRALTAGYCPDGYCRLCHSAAV